MPKYHVLEKSYINNRIVEAGEIVEYDGTPGGNLSLVEPELQGNKAKAPKQPAEKPADGLV